MKKLLTILFFFLVAVANAQLAPPMRGTDEEKLVTTVKEFHQALVKQNIVSINQQTDKALKYGHSNGWVQTKTDIIKDFETGYLTYKSFKEDSITVSMNGNMANVFFIADITATRAGSTNSYHLKVMEVWVKKSNRWVLFSRLAVKA